MQSSKTLTVASAAMTLFVAANPAWAGSNRAWVSGHGVDQAGCGAPTAPCRSLQYVHDHVVNAGGEIDILDPAGYGAIVITKAISIVNDGVGTAGVQATTGAAIVINAGATDEILLRGLSIEGLNAASNGVWFENGASLALLDSTVSGFNGTGVLFQPSGSALFYASNTRVLRTSGNGEGILIHPLAATGTVRAVLERVETVDNAQVGLAVDGSASTAGLTFTVTVSDSLLANNGGEGVYAIRGVGGGASTLVLLRNCTVANNVSAGLNADIFGFIVVGHSTITGNGAPFAEGQNKNGFVESYGDNAVALNDNAGSTPTLINTR